MSERQTSTRNRIPLVAWLGIGCAALFALILAGCGGGGADNSTSTPQGTATYASGRIAGFGSIVVNGVHYDETNAQIKDEDGAGQSRSALKLGMTVAVRAGGLAQASNVTTAIAEDVTILSLARGPVESVATDSLVVLGQTIKVTATTVFDDSLAGGLAAVKSGMVVQVFGLLDASTGTYTATRIEPSDADSYRLFGVVTALNPTAKTMNIGNALIDVSAVSLPDGLKVGSLVRVKLMTTQVNGAWVAISVSDGAEHPHDADHAEVDGIVTSFTSTTAFSVDGLPVDASQATFANGTSGLAQGAHVEVVGAVVNGVLVATVVKVETEQDMEAQGLEVKGSITSVDTVKSTFVVHGVTVSFAGSVNFDGGTASDLKVGAQVEVKGSLASDGTTLNATEISFED
ncbi:MAG: DUF5666 domain-containing protein [Gemmatimonadota bacterium]